MTDTQPVGELEIRTKKQGVEVLDVDFPERMIEVIVTPYEQEALVPYKGRMVREVFSRGAFDGLERRPNRIRVNRDHDVKQTIGRAVAIHPSRDEGLVAEIRISNTTLGNDTLNLAADGLLDASAGFMPMAGGEKWEERSLRRIVKAWLGHIALTPDPAYVGANVLAVREAAEASGELVATPNLDKVYAWRLEERYSLLDH